MLDKCVFGECYIYGGKLNLLMSKYTPLVNSTSNDKIFTADCIIKKQPLDSIHRIILWEIGNQSLIAHTFQICETFINSSKQLILCRLTN